MFSTVNRPIGAAVLGIALFGLGACSDSDSGGSVSTIAIQPSSYVVKDPVTTTIAPTVIEPDAEGRSALEQAYVVATSDDVPYNIAIMFDVDLDELRSFNGWEEGTFAGFEGVGSTVRIPPGAKFIDPAATTTTVATDDTVDDDDDEATPPATGSGDRCSPTYVIEAGDAPLVVTRKFDITIEELNAVNTATPNWPNFYTGATINLPPPDDC